MSWNFDFHPLVIEDIESAKAWYEQQKKGLGEKFQQLLFSKLKQIEDNPFAFASRIRKKYREAKVDLFPYAIVYHVDKKVGKVSIVSVHHSKRHPKKKFR